MKLMLHLHPSLGFASLGCVTVAPRSIAFGELRGRRVLLARQNFIGVSYNGSMYALGACGLGSIPSTPKTKI